MNQLSQICHNGSVYGTIYTDGASSGNPGPGGWGAIILTPEKQVIELGGAERHTTNNRMELTSVIAALEQIKDQNGLYKIHTDSLYVIQGITQWIHGWQKKGWKSSKGTPVLNRDLWELLYHATQSRKVKDQKLEWLHVRGHAGIPGNERADHIAVSYSLGKAVQLYRGPQNTYSVAI